MLLESKNLSPEQKSVLEQLLGRTISDEAISILSTGNSLKWLRDSWKSAQEMGLDTLASEEIDAEIAAARQARHERHIP